MTDVARLSPYLEAIASDLDAAAGRVVARRRRRRPIRIATLVLACVALLAGTALAGARFLGQPATPQTQAALDAYYPGHDGFSPLHGHSQVVATFGRDVLYHAPSKDGTGICTQITAVGDDGETEIPDAGCTRDTGDPYWPIGVQSLGFHERELVVGQVKAPRGATLDVVRSAMADVQILLGVDGFFLWELPRQIAQPGTRMEDMDARIGSLVLRAEGGATLASMPLTMLLRASATSP